MGPPRSRASLPSADHKRPQAERTDGGSASVVRRDTTKAVVAPAGDPPAPWSCSRDRSPVWPPVTGSSRGSWPRWVHQTDRSGSTGPGSNARCATWLWTTPRNESTTWPPSNASGSARTLRRWIRPRAVNWRRNGRWSGYGCRAYSNGLALALPQVVVARPEGFEGCERRRTTGTSDERHSLECLGRSGAARHAQRVASLAPSRLTVEPGRRVIHGPIGGTSRRRPRRRRRPG